MNYFSLLIYTPCTVLETMSNLNNFASVHILSLAELNFAFKYSQSGTYLHWFSNSPTDTDS